jgi:hypothetical protein
VRLASHCGAHAASLEHPAPALKPPHAARSDAGVVERLGRLLLLLLLLLVVIL